MDLPMKVKYSVSGLDCPHCAARLEELISKAEGIDSAKVNFLSEKVTVVSDLPAVELLATVRDAARAFSASVKIEEL